MCEKCLVRIEESVLLQVVCTGPLTCVWHTLNCKKKKKKNCIQFFFGVVRLGGVWGGVHVSGGRGLHGSFRGGQGDLSSGLSQPGGKSC